MYCKKCGKEVQEDWKYCPNCQANLENGNVETNEIVIIKKKKKEKINAMICLIVFIIGIISFLTFSKYKDLFFLMSLISAVTGTIKYPNNKLLKVVFWIYLILVLLLILISSYFFLTGWALFNFVLYSCS